MLIKKCAKGFSLLLIVLATHLLGQSRTSDFGLIGSVESLQSVTTQYYNPSITTTSGFLDSEQFDSIYLKFDRKRNLILKETFLDYRGKLGVFDRTTYQINPRNQIEKLETTLIQNGEEPRKIAQRKKFYYLNSQLIRVDEFNSGRTSDQYWVSNWVYDRGWLKEKVYWMEDEIFSKSSFEYDNNSNPIAEKTYSNNGNLVSNKLYDNNRAGLPVKISSHTGAEKNIETFEYGPNYLAKRQVLDANGKVILTEIYDGNGRIAKVEKLNYKAQSIDTYEFKFELDKVNNWVNCEISLNHFPTYQIRRYIKYY